MWRLSVAQLPAGLKALLAWMHYSRNWGSNLRPLQTLPSARSKFRPCSAPIPTPGMGRYELFRDAIRMTGICAKETAGVDVDQSQLCNERCGCARILSEA